MGGFGRKHVVLLLLVVLVLVIPGSGHAWKDKKCWTGPGGSFQTVYQRSQPPLLTHQQWQLVWQDGFETTYWIAVCKVADPAVCFSWYTLYPDSNSCPLPEAP